MGRSQRHMILEQGYNAAAASLDQGVVAPGLLLQVEGVTREGEYGGPLTGSTGLYAVDGVEVPYGPPGGPLGGSSLTGPVPEGGGGTDPLPGDIGPHIDSITPDTAALGAGVITVDVTGTNFNETCVVEFDQIAQPTTFVSATSLQGSFDASAVGLVEHAYNVTVRDNAIEEESNDVAFTLTATELTAREVSEGPLGIVSIYRRNGKLVITVADPIRVLPGTIITVEASGSSSVNGQYEVEEVNGNEVVVDSDFQLEKPIEGKGRLISQS